jgi:hypothetical protein
MTRKTRRTVRFLHGIPDGQLATCASWREEGDSDAILAMPDSAWGHPWVWVIGTVMDDADADYVVTRT